MFGPQPMNSDNRQILNPDRRLRAGCYYLHFEPTYPYWGEDDPPEDREREVVTYGGTMRVVHYNNAGDKALTLADARKGKAGQVLYLSGDLYALPPARGICFCKDIPIFPIKDYRFYLLATDIEPGDNGEFTLCLKSYEFSGGALNPCGIVRAILRWTEAPTGSHSAFDYLEGFVWDENDNLIGA